MSEAVMDAYLGIGSNLGDRWAHLRSAVSGLADLDPDVAVSPVYETAPVGGPQGQGPYLNCVARIDASLAPRQLLHFVQRLETQASRVRLERWGPRTLDIDILLVAGYTSDEPDLVVPHPRMSERAFVLAPLEDLDASLVPPDWRTRVACDEGSLRQVGVLVGPFSRHGAPSADHDSDASFPGAVPPRLGG
ncbi:MAG TPA: 2-amino-4-hydroxy-6-hydroxymethyldihydropteridine diphosphokinase [Acidimicrobiales bacterium]|nr:2-amino-4-hydroxy-6-hydroxymethyldihydropteridine diphosphokinase [Acidimicrobiales bacterium]